MRKNGLSGRLARLSAIALGVLSFGNVAMGTSGRGTDGWDNVNPARRFPEPVDVRWTAPVREGERAFRVDWRKGAKGRVVFGADFIRIEKQNDSGSVVVTPREPVAAGKGEVLQAAAGVSVEGAVDPERSRGFLRIYSGRENLAWQRNACGGKASDAPQFKTFVNAAPGNETRQLARCVVDASGAAHPVIVVEGRRSVSVWRHWTVEGAKKADAAWHERTTERREAPDRSATLMDEAAFDRMLAQDGDHVARLVRREEGARLEIDGKGVPPVFYKPIPFGMGVPFTGEGKVFERAGVNLQVVNVRFGVGGGRIGFWSKDGFDVAGAVRRVKDFMRSAPESLFLLTIRCDAYPEYAAEHPDEIWRRRDGSPVYGTCSQGEKTPSAKPPPGKWLWVSNHSLVWRDDVKRHMTSFVAALRDAGLAKRIVGVHLAGYHDGQFATPAEDFSPCALRAFESWQKETLGEVRWTGVPVFDDGEFVDPQKNPHAAEYQKFLKWGPMRMQEDFARHLKRAFGKPIVVGRWCMTPYGGALMSTLDFTPFLSSDVIDFLVAQPAYHRRAPGLVGGVRVPLASFREHGKLFLNEFDTRTWHGRSGETEPRAIFLSEATDLAMWETVHRKLAGQMFAQRMGWWYFDMADNWFDEPSILAEIASVRREADARLRTASDWRPSAAFVIDEEGCLLRNRVGRKLSMREAHGTAEQLQRLAGSGVPFDTCVAADFLKTPSLAARYKVLVLCGFYRIDAKRRAFVESARKAGQRLVFLVDAGALGGADAIGGDLRIDEPCGLTAAAFGEIVRLAGGYVPTRHGLQVDMNGDFVSLHCVIPGHYDFALPFAADVTNLKTGQAISGVTSFPLDLVGGETRWYSLEKSKGR